MKDLALIAGLLAAGCASPKEEAPLIEVDAWTKLSAAEDPFLERFAGDPACPESSFGLEELGGERSLGVDGQDCVYLTVRQPSLAEVEAGDLLHLRLWHFELVALDAATATVAITIDGNDVFSRFIPIPSDSELISPYWDADFDAPAGSEVLFHLENHGSNSYNLIELTRGGTRPSGPLPE